MKLAVQAQGNFDPVELHNVEMVGVYDDFDQLVSLIWKLAEGKICVASAGSKDFDNLAAKMSLEKRPVVSRVKLGSM